MKNKGSLTYQDYLHLLITNQKNDNLDYGLYAKDIEMLNTFSMLTSTVPFVLEFTSRSYPVLTDNIINVMGHPKEAFLEGGLDFMLYQHKDFDLLNKTMFPTEMAFLKENGLENLSQFRFSKSYRFKNISGKFSTILQQNTVISVKDEYLPIAIFGFVSDITHLTENGKVIHQIEQFASGNWKLLLSKEYYPDIDQNQLLSRREIEILKWSVEGFGSKQIAEKLFITFNTVNTHRRNMLSKTNSRNSMELLRYAIENKLL